MTSAVSLPLAKAPVSTLTRLAHDFGLRHRRVAVHDHLGIKLPVAVEVVPDPDQVLRILRVERDAGADAGVAEEEVAETR